MNDLVGCENNTTTMFDASRHDSPLSTVVDYGFIGIDDLDTERILIGQLHSRPPNSRVHSEDPNLTELHFSLLTFFGIGSH